MHGSRSLGAAIAAITVAATLAGCAPGSSAGTSPVATTEVRLPPSYTFEPASIAVTTGATVTWTNDDHFTHSVQFTDGGLPTDPLMMEPGASTTFTFPSAGTFHYQCSLHPQNMRGTVTVGA
jgi:plastocyanin